MKMDHDFGPRKKAVRNTRKFGRSVRGWHPEVWIIVAVVMAVWISAIVRLAIAFFD